MRRLVAALIAIVGLVLLAGSVNLLLTPLGVLFMEMPLWQSAAAIVLSLLPAAASMALAVYLIRARERIAVWYLPEDEDVPAVPAESLLRVGLVLLGLYLVVQAVPIFLCLMTSPFVSWLQTRAGTFYGDLGFTDQSAWEWLIESIPRVVSTLASLTLGFLLLAKREWIISRILGDGPVLADAAERTEARCQNCGASYDPADYDGGVVEPRCMNCKGPLGIPRT